MTVTAMRIKTTTSDTGASKSKTISPLAFNTAGTSVADRADAINYMAHRIVQLTTSVYGSTDMIVTTNTDTEVTNIG